jgi:hypothetical protein
MYFFFVIIIIFFKWTWLSFWVYELDRKFDGLGHYFFMCLMQFCFLILKKVISLFFLLMIYFLFKFKKYNSLLSMIYFFYFNIRCLYGFFLS